jgi:hypothetical protein
VAGSSTLNRPPVAARWPQNRCAVIAASPTDVVHKLDVLRRHCDDVGRDETTIRKTILYMGSALAAGDLEGFLSEMAAYANAGIDEVIVMPAEGEPAEWIERCCCASAVPRLAELVQGG